MILKISLRTKGGVPKTLLEQKHRLNFLYFPQNTLMLTESREEFSDLHSIFRLRALRYWYMDTGLRDLHVEVKRILKRIFSRLILPNLMTYVAKIYQIGLYMLC